MAKPIKGTEDSWLFAAGIKSAPSQDHIPRRSRGSRCAALPDRQRLLIYQAIEEYISADKTKKLKSIYHDLMETGILKCRETGLILSLGTIGRFTADVRVKMGIGKERDELRTRFATLKESKMRKSRIMNELSISVYTYDFLLRKYNETKRKEKGKPETPPES